MNRPLDVLLAFGAGRIGWREACRRLDIDTFDELSGLMRLHGLSPQAANPARKPDSALDALLYDESER